jgi:hypothetical protein
LLGDPNRKYIVTPVVPQWVFNIFEKIADRQGKSVEEVAKAILLQSQSDETVLRDLSPYFWRDYHTRTGVWVRNSGCRDINELLRFGGAVEHLNIPLSKTEWFQLDHVAYALCRTVHQAASALLLLSVYSEQLMNQFAPNLKLQLPRGTVNLRNSS